MLDRIHLMIILQKSCQNVKLLKMREKMIDGVWQKCAESHVFCAIPHTPHTKIMLIFAKTTPKSWKVKEKYL